MTISYNWLSEYLPELIEPTKLSKILTSLGLEVESMEKYERYKGGLDGLLVGEVLEVNQHPNADKLKITSVLIGKSDKLKIVCGANNVAVGQKVIVAPVGSTIHPINAQPVTMKLAKIRGEESQGMICAEDEIGIGTSHDGIKVLDNVAVAGMPAAEYFKNYADYIYEIGLTPNRMDAMSHVGVAKDVCAYLSFHNKNEARVKLPSLNSFKVDNQQLPIKVTIENTVACRRYAGITISGVTVTESPEWLKNKLLSIGQRPINNIVDITNYILHESGQPLHSFDAAAIIGNEVVIKNVSEETLFISLDEKERKLSGEDLMICNKNEAMCIAGVFGGSTSGVKSTTTSIFLESAWFNPIAIRKTSLRHNLRTEAAARFEKGVDISNVVNVLKRAALLIKEIAGGTISSDIIDVYPSPIEKTQVGLKYHFLKKLSGKNYHPDAIKKILTSLGFEIIKEGMDEIWVAVPFSKPDITLPADIVEEIVRVDGLDNIEITGSLTFTPSVDENGLKELLKEKVAQYLVGRGFSEIVTNSITNSAYYTAAATDTVKMVNNLSADLDIMRPSMLETGLEALAYNINRKNSNLQFFELGKTYMRAGDHKYVEKEHLCLYITGKATDSWKSISSPFDFYSAKGIAVAILELCGIANTSFQNLETGKEFSVALQGVENNHTFVTVAAISKKQLENFGIKQAVFFVDIDWQVLISIVSAQKIVYTEVPKFPMVQRDLAIIVDKHVTYNQLQSAVKKTHIQKLSNLQLFDVFESDKLGNDKKSMAVSFSFLDSEKTLTDGETDEMMSKLVKSFETELGAIIRN